MLKVIFLVVASLCLHFVRSARNDTHVVGSSMSTISWFLNLAPFFDLTKVTEISPKCRDDFEEFLLAIKNYELWALKSIFQINIRCEQFNLNIIHI